MDGDVFNFNTAVNEDTILECRTCLHIMSPDAILFNIFEMWSPPWDGMASTIAEDIEKLANIKVQQLDRHSKVICRTCYELLHTACTFATLVKRSDLVLLHRYPSEPNTPYIDAAWPRPIQINKSVNSILNENSMNVEIKEEILSDDEHNMVNGIYGNGGDFPDMNIKEEPEEMIQPQPSEPFTINGSTTSDTFDVNMTNLMNGNSAENLVTKIKEELLSEEETELTQNDLPLECLLCTKCFKTVTGLKAHVIVHHSYKSVKRKNNCVSPERNKGFPTPTDLMLRGDENKNICYACNEAFNTFKLLTKHSRKCKAIASQEVKRPKTLNDVIRPQPPDEPKLKCTHCDETFTDMYYVTIHQEIHHSTAASRKTDKQSDSAMETEALESIFTESSDF
ncbi:uncharacterized protein LOC112058421 isoform X2 [Bicyclus anynana]|uniref:Uncharacterized protein LOC112058421 isoform X2 n=1 Tax=Bicyclus anynana TaxID=110368 RepID=A0A6J1PB53_BICAN|nr:uncharacterized protein LOC112058421 isoform X2 [Bicyclus anynana]